MGIKLICVNHCVDFQKTEEELRQEKVITHCPYCGSKLSISNLSEIVIKDLEDNAKAHLKEYFNTLGIEASVELILRQPESKVKEIYKNLLRQKGLIK